MPDKNQDEQAAMERNSMSAEDIMREERDRTLAEIDKLPISASARADVLRACAVIQEALNAMLAGLGRPIDPRVGPAAMYLIADEIERLNKRFVAAGFTEQLH